eukprot:CAMPEP_0202459060 /NCGR_PEP_ID=MMETSP1360-20130828/30884_1 /ASSEMBLY_ACC=CAM_ASM_000848 /TAXON_ID=515479 /ORGANISM="Licmophora paradoxa, Strain CCMP2313" /LENGTH=125 /DNA_ID=CAMNT_0049079901 /DNA_START=20 /DNA_END=393 /DNA_ORIENTATION=+
MSSLLSLTICESNLESLARMAAAVALESAATFVRMSFGLEGGIESTVQAYVQLMVVLGLSCGSSDVSPRVLGALIRCDLPILGEQVLVVWCCICPSRDQKDDRVVPLGLMSPNLEFFKEGGYVGL